MSQITKVIKCNKNNVRGGAVSPKTCHMLNLPNVAVCIALHQTNPNTGNSGQCATFADFKLQLHNIALILSACFVFTNVHSKWGLRRFGETAESEA